MSVNIDMEKRKGLFNVLIRRVNRAWRGVVCGTYKGRIGVQEALAHSVLKARNVHADVHRWM
jgi:hypothetical protein